MPEDVARDQAEAVTNLRAVVERAGGRHECERRGRYDLPARERPLPLHQIADRGAQRAGGEWVREAQVSHRNDFPIGAAAVARGERWIRRLGRTIGRFVQSERLEENVMEMIGIPLTSHLLD